MVDFLLKKESSGSLISRLQIQKGASLSFYGGLLAFCFVLAGYGGLVFTNRSQLQTQDELEIQIRAKESELRPELINQIFILESRLKNMQTVLNGHVFTLNVLKLLELNTLSRVRFTSFNLTVEGRKIEMMGEASSYAVVTDQILLLERDPNIEKVEFGGITLGSNNLVSFQLSIVLRPSVFKLGAI